MSEARACDACGRLQSYPAPVCLGCAGRTFTTCTLPFTAEIYSQTVVSRAPTAELQALVPYAAVLVRGAAGGLLLLRMRGEAPGIGSIVVVREREGALMAERS